MKKAILAKKVGMTQIFDENGILIPVTVLEAGPVWLHSLRQLKMTDMKPFRSASERRRKRSLPKDKGGNKTIAHRQWRKQA